MKILDRIGTEYHLDVLWNAPLLTIRADWKGVPAGHVYASIDGRLAVLTDIYVEQEAVIRFSLLRKYLGLVKKKSFRGAGLGTALLKRTIEELRLRGAEEIAGEMKGDMNFLPAWYRGMGFTQLPGTNCIQLRLA